MKIAFVSLAVILGLALSAAATLAAEETKNGGRDGGRGGGVAHVEAGPAHVEGNASARGNVNRSRVDVNAGPRISDRNALVERNSHLGDRNFDRRGVGGLDEARFANSRDNNWRYRRWGNEWWYWLPTGNWDYWRDGRWYPYDANTYTYYENEPAPVAAANFNGPYYEDQNGFYYMNGSQRVYDPQVRRVAGEVGTLPGSEAR